MKRVQEFVELTKRKKQLEAELSEVKSRMASLELFILGEFERQGLQSVKTETGETVYLRRQVWASLKKDIDARELLDTLKKHNLEWLLSVHHLKLTAIVRENGGQVPSELEPFVDVSERFNIVAKGVSTE